MSGRGGGFLSGAFLGAGIVIGIVIGIAIVDSQTVETRIRKMSDADLDQAIESGRVCMQLNSRIGCSMSIEDLIQHSTMKRERIRRRAPDPLPDEPE